jgi:asparagine synthase (glutamine-hydrolysing)
MCGFLGAVAFRRPFGTADYRAFVRQTDLVHYRGPDDADYGTFDTSRGALAAPDMFDVFFGHRRLSIIDLSQDGRQPLTDGSGRWIIFVGEIFNYVELRDELRQRGHRFRTATDTEVILHLYAEYGDAGFAKMNGMWSLAILDLPARRLVLSRDRFSIKPLYYVRQDHRLLFASEIKQLLPFLSRTVMDRDVMHTFLAQALADHSDHTFFDGIRSVPPKHSLLITLPTGQVERRQYWNYTLRPVKTQDALAEFRDLFVDSVRLRLRSDVEVGALLSGGLDSSAIAVAANQVLGANLQTYSIVARDQRYSEVKFIDALARTGVSNRRIEYESGAALETIDAAIYHNDEPCSSLSPIAEFNVLKRVRAETGIKVVLSGQGGDECLLGYHKFFFFHLTELLRTGRVLPALRQILWSLLRRTTLWQFSLGEARRYLPFGRIPPYLPAGQTHPEPTGLGRNVQHRQMADLDKYSVPILAHWDDRFSMAHSIELRAPFLDHRLVDLAVSMPTDLKIRDGWTKYVLRMAMHELPPEIRWRRDKQGFLTPEEHWLRHELRPVFERTFANGRSVLAAAGVIDPRIFLAAYRRFAEGRSPTWFADFTRVFCAELWARRFLGAP